MKKFNWSVFAVLAFASLIPDLVKMLLTRLAAMPKVPFHTREMIGQVLFYPWTGCLFALCFAGAYAAVAGKTSFRRVSSESVISLVILVPFAQFLIPLLFTIGEGYLSVIHLPANIAARALYAAATFALARAALSLEIELPHILFIAILGGVIPAISAVEKLPPSLRPEQFWYFILGTFVALVLARKA